MFNAKSNFAMSVLAYLFLIITSFSAFAQGKFIQCEMKESVNGTAGKLYQSCLGASSAYQNQYRLQSSYIPSDSTPLKVIYLNFHVIKNSKDPDGGNFDITDSVHVQFLNDLVDGINNLYSNINEPSDPVTCVCGDCHIKDSRIRFELRGIFEHTDDSFYGKRGCDAAPDELLRNPQSEVNIFFHGTDDQVMGGCYNARGPNWMISEIGLTDYYHQFKINSFALDAGTVILAHEFGHFFGLGHTYGSETCNANDIDYLQDVFGLGTNSCSQTCPHEGGWDCDVYAPNHTCTNNLMGETSAASYLSPLQLGRIHRELSLNHIKKYVGNCPNSQYAMYITNDETWDFNMGVYQDIVIENSATLTIDCQLFMPPDAEIIEKDGGTLNLLNGEILDGCKQLSMNNKVIADPISINVWPNPADELIFIRYPKKLESNSCTVSFYNSVGKLVKVHEHDGQHEFSVNIADLSRGVFIIEVRNDRNISRKRVVVN